MGARRMVVAGLVGVLMVVGLGACGGGGGGQKADITANKFTRFDPDQLTARLNHQELFTFKNDDSSRQHNFTLSYVFTDASQTQNVSVDVAPGQTKDITFTVTQRPSAGFLTFYCRFHQAEGMSGRIKIT